MHLIPGTDKRLTSTRDGVITMFMRWLGLAGILVAAAACDVEETVIIPVGDDPAPPINLDATYFNQAVQVTWELSPLWSGESFRVYSRLGRSGRFLLISEVTSCSDGFCEYTDTNIEEDRTYQYLVSAIDANTGFETDSDFVAEVDVPFFDAPPVPTGVDIVALDDANFIRWDDNARDAGDFANYKVYLEDEVDGALFLLGETDSEGFLDLLAENGTTSVYVVSSVDEFGHESATGLPGSGTPRPDFVGELLFANSDVPGAAGFRFQESDLTDPIVSGSSALRHFRLEVDAAGWWLVLGPGAEIHGTARFTTALKCGPAADSSCEDWTMAPTSGYVTTDTNLSEEFTYVLRVIGDDGGLHYGAVRVAILGADQTGNSLMVFDWAYQIQAGNPNLSPGSGS